MGNIWCVSSHTLGVSYERTDGIGTSGLSCTILRNTRILKSSVQNDSSEMEYRTRTFETLESQRSDLVDGKDDIVLGCVGLGSHANLFGFA